MIEHGEDDKKYYLVFPFLDGVNLFKFMKMRQMKALDDETAGTIIRQLVEAVSYCNTQGTLVAHFDHLMRFRNFTYGCQVGERHDLSKK